MTKFVVSVVGGGVVVMVRDIIKHEITPDDQVSHET